MGVSVEAQRPLRGAKGLPCVARIEHVLILVMRSAMADLRQIIHAHGALRQRGQPGASVCGQRGRGPFDGHARDRVEAVDAIDPGADLVMVAANNGRDGQPLDQVDHFVRIGAVPHHVTEDEDALVVIGGRERGLQRVEIRVDVADDEVLHGVAIDCQYPISTRSTRAVAQQHRPRGLSRRCARARPGTPPDGADRVAPSGEDPRRAGDAHQGGYGR